MDNSSSLPAAAPVDRTRLLVAGPAWLLFALLTAALTLRHALWFDEMQAWLLVRDSASLGALFQNLHYEGHPALWYLLLYPLTRLTANPAVMQVLNELFAWLAAALVLTMPRLRPAAAVLIVFSSILFNEYSTYARSYMLATLLLLAAVRLLVAERPRPLGASLCLGLAINTHFLTVPLALALAVWFAVAPRFRAERSLTAHRIRRRTLAAAALLAASLLACYLTVRPAADLLPLNVQQPSALGHFFFVEGRIWRIFFRVPIGHLSPHLIDLLDPQRMPSAVASGLSALTLLLTLLALHSREARIFFAAASVFGLAVLAAVTLSPEIRHYGFLYVAFVAAVLIDASTPATISTRKGFCGFCWNGQVARWTLYLILAQQCLLSLSVAHKEWRNPISGSLQTARWLRAQHLEANPMILQPSEGPNAVLGYLNKSRAWFPVCQCWGSYAHRALGTDPLRTATPADIATARANSTLPVILVANAPLDAATQKTLGVAFLFASSPAALKTSDNFFVYRQIAQEEQPACERAKQKARLLAGFSA